MKFFVVGRAVVTFLIPFGLSHASELPTMLVGGHKIGIKHQGHLTKKDVRLGNLWQTMFDVMDVKVPDNFQGGEADGTIKEILSS